MSALECFPLMPLVLMTDFGLQDTYVGVMKGVISQVAPQANVIDLTHAIAPQNVKQAAFRLRNAYHYFPAGTIFLVVVDPGVGSTRRPMAVQSGEYLFVAPDNGVLSYVLAALDGFTQASEIRVDQPPISNTFHGRDVFAPAAAKLAAGVGLETLGDPIDDLVRLVPPVLQIEPRYILGEVVDIDRFGNLITSIGELSHAGDVLELRPVFGMSRAVLHFENRLTRICIRENVIKGIQRTYADIEQGALMALIGSSSFLEISINQGNAAHQLNASIGDPIEIIIGE
jgi:S-adenosyl-L-methionine hydrolase (adenosine-forming)